MLHTLSITLQVYAVSITTYSTELIGKFGCSVAKSHPTFFCDRMDCSLPGSSVHGTPQARILKWVAISFSRGSSWPRGLNNHLLCSGLFTQLSHEACMLSRFSCVRLFVFLWTMAHQAPLLLARILEWVAIPFPRDLPGPEIEPFMSPVLAIEFFTTSIP